MDIGCARYEAIIAGYEAELDGRDPSTVSILDLLPGIYARVPNVSNDEIVAALRWSARKKLREADSIEAEHSLRH
jgi:hypothetical protein